MNTSKEEFERAKEIVEEKLKQASQELAETIEHEQHLRRSIEHTEQTIHCKLDEEQQNFHNTMKQQFQNSKLHRLNELLQEAIAKDDRQAIEEIMRQMSK